MYVVVVSVTVKKDHLNRFEQAVLKNAAASVRQEKECHRFDVCQKENSPEEWMLYEVYSDRAAFDFHHEQPHFLEYNAVAQEAVTSKRILTFHLKN